MYQSVEFHGEGIARLSLESRMVIPNMMAELGAKNAWLPPDEAVFDYLAERRARRQKSDVGSQKLDILANAIYPDGDAVYANTHTMDASRIELTVACPHAVDNARPLREVAGTRVHQAFIGTCTNGRLEDLAAAAAILKGKRVATGTRLLIIPASAEVYGDAIRLGHAQTLMDAGAVFGVPGCGPCMGNHMGVPAPGEVCISTANRNFKGRMGQPDADIYLASPAVVAASAVAGVIADPREIE